MAARSLQRCARQDRRCGPALRPTPEASPSRAPAPTRPQARHSEAENQPISRLRYRAGSCRLIARPLFGPSRFIPRRHGRRRRRPVPVEEAAAPTEKATTAATKETAARAAAAPGQRQHNNHRYRMFHHARSLGPFGCSDQQIACGPKGPCILCRAWRRPPPSSTPSRAPSAICASRSPTAAISAASIACRRT
jgi:hypothetical protein